MFKLIQNLLIKRKLEKASKWFEKHEPAQQRFEDIEDWLEDLEERIINLEEIAHPKCGIESFDGYKPLIERIDKLEVIVGVLKKESDNR